MKSAANVSQQLRRERKLERASLKLVRERAVCQELLTDPFVLLAECVDQDVAFASLYALVRVEATSATTLGRLDRLAIHDYHRWTSCPSGMAPGLLVEHAM
jgi:hypothetical protein